MTADNARSSASPSASGRVPIRSARARGPLERAVSMPTRAQRPRITWPRCEAEGDGSDTWHGDKARLRAPPVLEAFEKVSAGGGFHVWSHQPNGASLVSPPCPPRRT